jgi:tryptophan synthase alpha chain
MKKLVAYITCAFPDKNFTEDLILSLKENGVDFVELGVPFSDPVADGPVIEKANLQALQSGFKMKDLFEVSSKVAKEIDTLWMGYFNPFYKNGVDFHIKKAKEYGIKGFIIPDLPYEEAKKYKQNFIENDISLIDFVAPTDSRARIKEIVKDAKTFIYLVAYAGITGAGKSEDLTSVISHIREVSDTDIFLGFGVNERTAKEKSKNVDGVIVGSAFVKILLDENLTNIQKIDSISNLASYIKNEIS